MGISHTNFDESLKQLKKQAKNILGEEPNEYRGKALRFEYTKPVEHEYLINIMKKLVALNCDFKYMDFDNRGIIAVNIYKFDKSINNKQE